MINQTKKPPEGGFCGRTSDSIVFHLAIPLVFRAVVTVAVRHPLLTFEVYGAGGVGVLCRKELQGRWLHKGFEWEPFISQSQRSTPVHGQR